jgi:hypothetical protein
VIVIFALLEISLIYESLVKCLYNYIAMAVASGRLTIPSNFDTGLSIIIPLNTIGRSIYAATTEIAGATYSTASWPHTLSAGSPLTIDGVVVGANDMIIVTAQSTSAHNGVYIVTTAATGLLTRMASWIPPVKAGTFQCATAGTTNNKKSYRVTTQINVIGTDACTFIQDADIAPIAHLCTYDVLPTTVVATATTLTAGVNQALVVDASTVVDNTSYVHRCAIGAISASCINVQASVPITLICVVTLYDFLLFVVPAVAH